MEGCTCIITLAVTAHTITHWIQWYTNACVLPERVALLYLWILAYPTWQLSNIFESLRSCSQVIWFNPISSRIDYLSVSYSVKNSSPVNLEADSDSWCYCLMAIVPITVRIGNNLMPLISGKYNSLFLYFIFFLYCMTMLYWRSGHRLTGEVDKRAIPGISWNSSLGWEGSMAFR